MSKQTHVIGFDKYGSDCLFNINDKNDFDFFVESEIDADKLKERYKKIKAYKEKA